MTDFPSARSLITAPRVLVIAHRGNSRIAPENTLPSFESALAVSPDFVEFDYWHSADGVPVVFHDEELDRTTNARNAWTEPRMAIFAKTLAELRTLDAGSWFGAEFVGTRIPTLAEALDLILPRSMAMIERKGGDATTCVELLRTCSAPARVNVQAFEWQYIAECRRLAPGLLLGALGEKQLTNRHVQEAKAIGVDLLGWEAEHLGPAEIELAHRAGLKVWAWTVDDPDLARRLIAAGLDGLISNVPAVMLEVVAATPRPAR